MHERSAESIQDACSRSRTRFCWIVNYLCDYTGFDFLWEPQPWEADQCHAWPSQWQKDSGTYLVPQSGYQDTNYHASPIVNRISTLDSWKIPVGMDVDTFDWSWHPDATDPPYIYEFGTQHQRTGGPRYVIPDATEIKYVDQVRIKSQRVATAIIEIDHLDGNAGKISDTVRTSRYFDNYLDTLRRIAKNIGTDHEFVWICSSICDYTDFDFSWHPEQWQAVMLHVFPSGDQKFGDTFFMHVPTFQYRADTCQLLEWYDLNFITHTSVPRHSMPVIQHDDDSHVEPIKTSSWSGPLALFTNRSVDQSLLPVVPLWREKTKTVVPLDAGGSAVIVPRAAVPYVKTQVYDYPYIDKTKIGRADPPCDVIFISNGEPMAEENWNNLIEMCPRAKRSDGIIGRESAYKAAATLSETKWFFAVFAKTQVLDSFDFSYQPDRMQQPKHYIFHSRNPLNGLEYGSMNINLYNKQLVLDTKPGLDFTLSSPHEVVPICASISKFNTDPWITWRSAFREVLKLKQEVDAGADVEIQHRLHVWCTYAQGENAEYCLRGSKDALHYYDIVHGSSYALQKSFDWQWLQDYYFELYGQRPWLKF